MKALSIIGIILSLAGILTGIYVISEGQCYCYDSSEYGYSHDYTDSDVTTGASIFILLSIFFLVFSIVATIVSFRKSGNNMPPMAYQNYQQPFNPQQPPYPPQQPYNQQPYQPYNPLYQQPTNPQNPNYYQQPPQQPPYNPGDGNNQ